MGIIEMRVCSEQRILVTLDIAGNILIWDQDYCYIRSILSNNNDVENNFSENKIEILPTSGEILHAEQNVNSTNEPVIKLKLYSINASLEVARMLENLSLVSLCVTDVDEGKAVNSVFVGVSQRDGSSSNNIFINAILILSSWDLQTTYIINTEIRPNFQYFFNEILLIFDDKNLHIYGDKSIVNEAKSDNESILLKNRLNKSKNQANKILKNMRTLPFWLVNPEQSSNLIKID